MNLSSLNRTLPNIKHIEPIYLKNCKRAWNAIENKTKTLATTYLGIEKESGSTINCIIFELPQEELLYIDQREFLYFRELVEISDLETIKDSILSFDKDDKIWIYITKNPKFPDENHPLIQSYIDMCISGCIELEVKFKIENFALDFINSTKNWSKHWVNDRIYPRAPHIYQPYAYKIDTLLYENLPELFKGIIIE